MRFYAGLCDIIFVTFLEYRFILRINENKLSYLLLMYFFAVICMFYRSLKIELT